MRCEYDYWFKQGDRLTITGTLKDVDGVVNLTGYTLKLVLTAQGSTTRLIDDAITPANQGTNPGEWSYLFTAPQAAFDVGVYDMAIKGTDAGGLPVTFPNDPDKLYYKLAILESK